MGLAMNIGIIGEGVVGTAQHELFPNAFVYDEPKLREAHKGIGDAAIRAARCALNMCDVSFLAVPTPSDNEKRLDVSIVEDIMKWCESDVIVLRSAVNPGDSDRWTEEYGRRIVVQPEYMGETPNHPFVDHQTRPFIVLGGEPEDTRKVIEAYTEVYNANVSIRQVTRLAAEVIKLSENRAIAWKVAQAQELYDACEAAGIDYYTVREAVYGDDPRMNLWFTFIFPDNRGMESKCIPKDPYAWCAWAESNGVDPKITKALLEKNKEWIASNAEA